MTDGHTEQICPDDARWHEYVDDRQALPGKEVAALDVHLDGCPVCTSNIEQLRRFRTLLLRTRVEGLDETQWQVLDERMQMMGSEYVPPQSRFGRVYWGVAAAAAVTLLAVGAWVLLERDFGELSGTDAAAARQGPSGRSRLALRVGTVDGQLEVADRSGAWRQLHDDDELRAGMALRPVGAEGALVSVPGHARLRLAADSEVRLLSADGHSLFLRLRRGEVGCQVDRRQPGQGFAVMAGRFRVAVVGTEFVVRHDRRSEVTVQVSEGAVRVDEADHPRSRISETTTVVRAGSRWHFASGRVEFGPMQPPADPAPAAGPGLTVQEEQLDPSEAEAAAAPKVGVAETLTPPPDRAKAAKSAAKTDAGPAAEDATVKGRKIIIHIPPQGMSDAEIQRLKDIERLLFGPAAQRAGSDDSTDLPPVP